MRHAPLQMLLIALPLLGAGLARTEQVGDDPPPPPAAPHAPLPRDVFAARSNDRPPESLLSGMGQLRRRIQTAGSFQDWLEAQGAPQLKAERLPFGHQRPWRPALRPRVGPNAVVNNSDNYFERTYPQLSYQMGATLAAWNGCVLVGFNDTFGLWTPFEGITAYGYSTDGGATWVDAGGLPHYGRAVYFTGDPIVVRDDAGNFYMASMVLDYQGDYYQRDVIPGIAVGRGRFRDGAFVWDTVYTAVQGKVGLWDKEWLGVDPATGELYLTYTRFTPDALSGRIELVASRDGGRTWEPPVVVGPAGQWVNQGSRPIVGPRGEVYVVWEHGLYDPEVDEIVIRRSDDRGRTFGPIQRVRKLDGEWRFPPPGSRRPYQHFPVIAVDRSHARGRGELYVAWNEAAPLLEGPWNGVELSEGDNEGPPTAQRVALGDDVVAQMDREEDQDWFRLHLDQGQAVVIRAQAEWPADPVAFLICEHDRLALAGNDDDYGTTGAILKYVAQATGDVLIQVVPQHFQALGDYRLTVRSAQVAAGSVARDLGDILVSRSRDGGCTWSEPVRANDGPPSGIEVFPSLAVDERGLLLAGWVDAREGTSCWTEKGYHAAFSRDGRRFGPSFAVSDTAVTWFGFPLIIPNFGDYTDAAADGRRVHAAWSDGRDGTPDIWTGWAEPRRGRRAWHGDAEPGDDAEAEGDPVAAGPVAAGGIASPGLTAALPNPAARGITLEFALGEASTPTLRVYDLAGRHVATLLEGRDLPAGRHARFWDLHDGAGRRVPAGVYLARWELAGRAESRRIVVLAE